MLHPFFLFGRTERPDRTGTNIRLFDVDVDGHYRRWMWTPIALACAKDTVRADSAGEALYSAWTQSRFFR